MSKMMYFALLIIAYAQICNSFSARIHFDNDLPLVKNAEENSLSNGITEISFKLDRTFTKMKPGENVIFSPLSITTAMALLLLGAKGYTALQLAEFLGLNTKEGTDLEYRIKLLHDQFGKVLKNLEYNKNASYELDTAAGVFPANHLSISPNYNSQAKGIYKSDVWPLDYQFRHLDAKRIINKWVASKTHDRIKQLLTEAPSPDTSVIVASALYFNGNWKIPFPKAFTKRANFFVGKTPGSATDEVIKVDLMINIADVPYLEDEARDCQMIGLPYKGDEVHMYIILPNGNLESFMKKFSVNDLKSMIQSTVTTTVTYAVPKMTLDNSVDITNVLRSIGLAVPFDASKSDYTNIANGVYVDKILHRVELEVDEVGTKASAATIGGTDKFATPLVRADRPFLFFIHHKQTDTILFWGKIIRPTPNFPAEVKVKTKRRHLVRNRK